MKLKRFWCRLFHRRILWPVNGSYQCSTCLERFNVSWDIGNQPTADEITAGIESIARASERVTE
jgi:hypothetical protein